MTVPLPASGDTSWYDWATYVDGAVNTRMAVVGSAASPIADAATARPAGAIAVYWMCAAGVTPVNAVNGDLIWNA